MNRRQRELTEDERTTITNGLRVAAERFDEHVRACECPEAAVASGMYNRLAEQFKRQASDSRALADLIDGCEWITVQPYLGEPLNPNSDMVLYHCFGSNRSVTLEAALQDVEHGAATEAEPDSDTLQRRFECSLCRDGIDHPGARS